MLRSLFLLLLTTILLSALLAGNFSCTPEKKSVIISPVLKIEMYLSAFGVESDSFPSIRAIIDLALDSSFCGRSYYNPAIKGANYHLSPEEMKQIEQLLQHVDLEKLKIDYRSGGTDQPTSTTTIYTAYRKYVITDYGLGGDPPLQKLYKIVYKF